MSGAEPPQQRAAGRALSLGSGTGSRPLRERSGRSARRLEAVARQLTAMQPSAVEADSAVVATPEAEDRVQCAAAYRLASRFGWDTGSIYNHITVRSGEDAASGAPHFLINPFGLDFSEVSASSLLKVDLDGTVVDTGSTDFTFNLAGFVIHSAVHASREDLRCVIHSHHRSVVAVASTTHGLLPCSLEACKLAPLVSDRIHAFEGIASDPEECGRIQEELGDTASILLMSNHGAIVGGATVGAALLNMLELVNSCNIQLDMMQAVGGDVSQLVLPTQAVVDETRARGAVVQARTARQIGELEMESWLRLLDEEDQSYRD